MKKFLTILTLVTALAVAAWAQVVTYDLWLTWNQNPSYELVTGYRIEYKKSPAVTNWTFLAFVPSNTNITVVRGLQGGYVYQFRAFAVNAIGTGTNLSNVIQIPTNAPTVVTNFSQTTPK